MSGVKKPDCARCERPYEEHSWGPYREGGMGYKDYGMCYALGPISMYSPKATAAVKYRFRVWTNLRGPVIGEWHPNMRGVIGRGVELGASLLKESAAVDKVCVALEQSDNTVIWETWIRLPTDPKDVPDNG